MTEKKLNIQRIYTKETSLIAKNTPELFKEVGPAENKLEIKIEHKALHETHHYEVVLNISVTTTIKPKDKESLEAVVIKVQQAGIFELIGFDKDEQEHLFEVYCPDVIYPYVRHVVGELMMISSMPPMILAPIDFSGLYQRKKEEKEKGGTTTIEGEVLTRH